MWMDSESEIYTLRMPVLNQNMRTDVYSEFYDFHISEGLL